MSAAWAERWRNLWDRLQAQVDRITHPWHRRNARLRWGRRGRPRKILIVCSGNICRSPYAAALLRASLEQAGFFDAEIESAGFIGPNRPADHRGTTIAQTRGIDLSGHRSRLVTAEDGKRFELIFVMTRRHRDELVRRFEVPPDRIALLGDFDPTGAPEREIPDPYGQTDPEFLETFAQIERSVGEVCRILSSGRA